MLYSKLRTHYCEKYLSVHDTSLAEVESLLSSYFPFDNRLGYFIFCTERQLFNAYTASEFDYFSKNEVADKSEYDNQRYAVDLYSGLHRYKHNCDPNNAEDYKKQYSYCAELLDKALTYKPNDSLNDILDDCLHRSGNFERLFWLKAYRHYDREDDNILKTAQLYLLYRKIKHPPHSFAQLCQNIKNEVLSDTVKRFIVSAECPNAANCTVTDIDGHPITLLQNNNNTIVLFFSVTCHNCINEMNTLSKMAEKLSDKHINVVGVYTMYNNPQTASDELKTFQTKHLYPFPTFLDTNRSNISSQYGISSVPSILLLRDDGTPVGIGSFSHYGHLSEKFCSIFSLFD